MTRRSVDAVGEFHSFSYTKPALPASIPNASVDLVTMNQGLHHLPQDELMSFLADVVRVLRPGGMFIVREHDATDELIPVCNATYWGFNAVTGVSAADERKEIRAFRPIAEWRKVLEGAGLCDSMLYEVEAGDPTQDKMMCFYKPPFCQTCPKTVLNEAQARETSQTFLRSESGASVGGNLGAMTATGKEHGQPRTVQESIDAMPQVTHDGAVAFFESMLDTLPELYKQARQKATLLEGVQRIVAERALDAGLYLLTDISTKILAILKNSHVKKGNDIIDLPLDEIFLAIETLSKKPLDNVDPDSNVYQGIVSCFCLAAHRAASDAYITRSVRSFDSGASVRVMKTCGSSMRHQGQGT